MKKITLSFLVLAAIIAVVVSLWCPPITFRCAKPTLSPPSYSGPMNPKPVTITTATTGAHLIYTLNGSTPTPSNGTVIWAATGTVPVDTTPTKTLKARAYKKCFYPSYIASGTYGQ
jgi:Fn3 domain-containing protein